MFLYIVFYSFIITFLVFSSFMSTWWLETNKISGKRQQVAPSSQFPLGLWPARRLTLWTKKQSFLGTRSHRVQFRLLLRFVSFCSIVSHATTAGSSGRALSKLCAACWPPRNLVLSSSDAWATSTSPNSRWASLMPSILPPCSSKTHSEPESCLLLQCLVVFLFFFLLLFFTISFDHSWLRFFKPIIYYYFKFVSDNENDDDYEAEVHIILCKPNNAQ